jgi:hypothetical protein
MKLLFRRTMTQKIEDTIAALAKRGEQLAVKRAKAQDALDKATKARQDALLSGDLDDQRGIDKLQSAVDSAASALVGIDDAISILAQQRSEAEAALAEERERVARTAAADKLTAQVTSIERAFKPWLEQSRIFTSALTELAHWHFGAEEMSQFLENCMGQLETAMNFQVTELKAMPVAIRDGRQAVPAEKPVPAPIVMTEQPAPTMTVFMIKSAHYRDHEGRKRFAGQYDDAIMPVPTAQKAMRLGLAVRTADPIRATHRGARGGDYRADAPDVVDIDAAVEHSGVPFIGPETSEVLRAAEFRVIDRGPARTGVHPVARVL